MDRSEKKPFLDREAGSYGASDGGTSTKQSLVAKLRRVGAEVLGTFFLMFAACGSIMAGWDVMGQALTVAFALVMLISSLGPISGAHFNPAISLAFAATRQFRWSEVAWYVGAQVVGGTAAMWVVKEVYDDGSAAASLTQPSGGWSQSFLMEVLLSFSLAFIATATNILPNIDGIQGGAVVGLTVAMNMILGGGISGASMNPVRSLAPAIIQNNYKQLWIYIFAPIIGATLGAFSFQLIYLD